VLAELRNRGVQDVLVACVDGLTGLPEAIEATFSQTVVQISSVHHGVAGGPAGHPRRAGQDLCKSVAFEVQTQTCPAGRWRALHLPAGAAPMGAPR
jgi:transposase-like protein